MLHIFSLLLLPLFALPLEYTHLCDDESRILTSERHFVKGPPPTFIPETLRWAYTRCGVIPVSDFYIDDSRGGNGTRYSHGRKDIFSRVAASVKELSRPHALAASGGQASRAHLLNALKLPRVASLLARGNASVVVFGSTSPTVEALLLAAGAGSVLTVEYNELAYDHPQLTTARPSEVEEAWRTGNTTRIPPPESFDLAASISSFDHDGLGRYGDPLAPDGDLLAMDGMARYLKPKGGMALLTVPLGPDRLWWNLMRTYGKVRLRLLLEGWDVLERVGWRGGAELENPTNTRAEGLEEHHSNPGRSHEPVFLLARQAAGAGGETPSPEL